MTLLLDLTPELEAYLSEEARRQGVGMNPDKNGQPDARGLATASLTTKSSRSFDDLGAF